MKFLALIMVSIFMVGCGETDGSPIPLQNYYEADLNSSTRVVLRDLNEVPLNIEQDYVVQQNGIWDCQVSLTLTQIGFGRYKLDMRESDSNPFVYYSCLQIVCDFDLVIFRDKRSALISKVGQ